MSVTPPQQEQPRNSSENSRPEGEKPGRRRAVDLDQETFRRYARFTGWLVVALIVAYIGLQAPLPYRLLAVAAGFVGLIGGVVLLVQAIRRRLPALILVSALAAIVCCGMFAATASAQVVFWGATAEFDQCRANALTERSMTQCYLDYEDQMLTTIPGMSGSR
ncbi:hypothetical protein [Nesterenkonia sp. HG001]|uniref:hypothetical protein n=1 Tax=Nesterenkonia sp. HG001 TaxID=2983207 RepID=UPI002AC627D1|nr:hypothetical protein [Nesterenkonia sp. HG001]MDZ5078988.1 hypothetical protein [Nesterenkonia sp. HG001]